MKILIYAHLFPPSKGGMQYQNLQIVQGLASLGHDVEAVVCKDKGTERFVKGLDFPVHFLQKLPFAPMTSLTGIQRLNWVFIPFYLIKIRRIISKTLPEIVLVADETSNFFWGFCARFFRIPYVSYCSVPLLALYRKRTDSIFSGGFKHFLGGIPYALIRKIFKVSYTNSELVLAVSNSTKNELMKELPELADKIYIVPNSIDDHFFNSKCQDDAVAKLKNVLGISESHFVIVSVTRLTMDKGVDDVIQALSGLSPPALDTIRYVVIGEGPAESYLKQLSEDLNLNRQVVFVGGVPHLELMPYYDLCDFFILPPRRGAYESFGRVFVEAAARSKPSIGAREGGMLDVIDDGRTGFLAIPGDPGSIREKISYLMNHREDLLQMGKKARRKAENNFTSRLVALQFEKHLKCVIERHRAASWRK